MMQASLSVARGVAVGLTVAVASVAWAQKPSDAEVQKVIKTVVNSIRYNKDDIAAKQVAFEPMAKAIMDASWKDLNDAQRKEIVAGLEKIIKKVSFTKGREMFQHLDAILYAPITMKGEDVICRSTVVVNRNYKKAEVVIDFVLVKDAGAWKIKDTVMAGESTAASIHEDQVAPLLQEGGVEAVMKALRDKLAELS